MLQDIYIYMHMIAHMFFETFLFGCAGGICQWQLLAARAKKSLYEKMPSFRRAAEGAATAAAL